MTTLTMTIDTKNAISCRDEINRLQRVLSVSDLRLLAMGEKNMDIYATRKALAGKTAV